MRAARCARLQGRRGGDPDRLGTASPFNIKLKSLRLGDFTADEVRELYAQHTADTGQEFTADAVDRACRATPAGSRGWSTPWPGRSSRRSASRSSEPITVDHMEQAKERLILARATHLDSLAARLAEPRVRRVIEPVIAGDTWSDARPDLRRRPALRCATSAWSPPPTRSASPTRSTARSSSGSSAPASRSNVVVDPRSFVAARRAAGLRPAPARVRRASGASTARSSPGGMDYHEAAPQLVFMGFLQRVVNGGGYMQPGVRRRPRPHRPARALALPRPGRQTAVAARGDRAEGVAARARPTRPPRGSPSSTATSTASTSTTARWSSSTAAPTPPPSPNAPGSSRPPARPAAPSPSCAPDPPVRSTRAYD